MWDSVFIRYDPTPRLRPPPPPPPRPVDDSSNRRNLVRDGRPRVVTITDQRGTLASYPLEEHFFDLPCKCDECKVKGSPPERPRSPPSTSRRSRYESPPYDLTFSDTPVRTHIFADLSAFRDLPRPHPEGSDEDRAKGKLKALASDEDQFGGQQADSDGKEESGSSSGESHGSSQPSHAAQGGSVQHEGSKGGSKRIGPRGPISAAKGVDSSGPSAKSHPAVTDVDCRGSAQRTGSPAPKRGRRTSKLSELSITMSKYFKSPKRNGGLASDIGRVYFGPPLLERVSVTTKANGKASASRLEDAENTAGCKPKPDSSKGSKEE